MQARSVFFAAANYVDRSGEYINPSQTHECGNWDWSRTIPRKGIHKWDFRCRAEENKAVKPWSWCWCPIIRLDVKGEWLESLRAVPSELTRLEGRRETMGPCWGRGGGAPPPGSPVEEERRKSWATASCFLRLIFTECNFTRFWICKIIHEFVILSCCVLILFCSFQASIIIFKFLYFFL